MTVATFSQAAREIAGKFVKSGSVEYALSVLGSRAEKAIDAQDSEAKAGLISHFVRNLRDLSVQDSTELERQMLKELGALPSGGKTIVVRDDISVILLRNYVRYLSVLYGMEWSRGMMVQSALSDLARFALAKGKGTFEVLPAEGVIMFRVRIEGELGGSESWLSGEQSPLLAGVRNVAHGLSGAGSRIEFCLDCGSTKH